MMVTRILDSVRELVTDGVTVLLVEQMVNKALAAADYAYVLGRGQVVLEGPAAELSGHPDGPRGLSRFGLSTRGMTGGMMG